MNNFNRLCYFLSCYLIVIVCLGCGGGGGGGGSNSITDTVGVGAEQPTHTLQSLSLSQTSAYVGTNEEFDLSSVTVTAIYSDGSSLPALNTVWAVQTGSGSITGRSFLPTSSLGTTKITCSYSENGVNKTADFIINIVKKQFISGTTLGQSRDWDSYRTYSVSAEIAVYNEKNELIGKTTSANSAGGFRLGVVESQSYRIVGYYKDWRGLEYTREQISTSVDAGLVIPDNKKGINSNAWQEFYQPGDIWAYFHFGWLSTLPGDN